MVLDQVPQIIRVSDLASWFESTHESGYIQQHAKWGR